MSKANKMARKAVIAAEFSAFRVTARLELKRREAEDKALRERQEKARLEAANAG